MSAAELIPVEIWDDIALGLYATDIQSLYRLSMVSRYLREICLRYVFRSIKWTLIPGLVKKKKMDRILSDDVTRMVHLLTMNRSIRMHIQHVQINEAPRLTGVAPSLRALNAIDRIIPLMRNVRTVHVNVMMNTLLPSIYVNILNLPNLQEVTLAKSCHFPSALIHRDMAIARSRVRRLRLELKMCYPWDISFPSNTCRLAPQWIGFQSMPCLEYVELGPCLDIYTFNFAFENLFIPSVTRLFIAAPNLRPKVTILLTILRAFPNIKELRFSPALTIPQPFGGPSRIHNFSLPSDIASHLRKIIAAAPLCSMLLPGRPINVVEFRADFESLTEQELSTDNQAEQNRLEISTPCPPYKCIISLQSGFKMAALRSPPVDELILTVQNVAKEWTNPSTLYELSRLSALQVLRLKQSIYRQEVERDESEERIILDIWKGVLSTLKEVELLGSSWIYDSVAGWRLRNSNSSST
ncbi:hypothetical protein FRC03_010756 [Tulasnella sp. 419]|nr:hypothetical protein FRC03_010756 [Tulasnella sp. 419]